MADEETIFGNALDCPTPAERAAYLEQACAGDLALKERLQKLLDAHACVGSILDVPPPQTIDLLIAEPAGEGAGAQIGPYKLLELIGEGGMGLVYMAQQEQPIHRKVALKILKPGMDTRQVLVRFDAERHTLSRLDHPGIARVLDAGTAPSGRPYFVMELVRGISINEFCDDAQLDTRQRLELFIRVCHAVQHAHEEGIVHRDLKPSNILVTIHDDVPVPKIIDFGIAKAMQQRLVDQTLFTSFLQMIGTPAYMSPEQAQLTSLEIDARSDVYSLGVLLYELLTGAPPFGSDRLRQVGYVEAQRIIRNEEPARPSARVATLGGAELSTVATRRSVDPRQYSKSLRGDLDWIVMRALEKDRNRRYASAEELAADVRRHLQSVPVQARRPTIGYRLQKFLRRQRTLVLLSTVAVAIGAIALGAFVLHSRRQQAVQESIRQLAYVTDIQRAAAAADLGRFDEVERILAAHDPARGEADRRGFEWHYLSGLCSAQPSVLSEHQGQVFDVAWSRSGKYMATSSGDRTVIVRDGETGVPIQTLDGFPDDVNSATFLQDESLLAVAEDTKEVSIWNWPERRVIQRLSGFDYPVARVFPTADPDIVVVTDVQWGSDQANSSTWRLSTGERLRERKQQRTLAVEPRTAVIAHRDDDLKLGLGVPANLEGNRLPTNYSRLYETAAISDGGELLAAGAVDGSVEIWRLGKVPHRVHLFGPKKRVRSVALSPDGLQLAAGGNDGFLRVWDLATFQLKHVLRPDRGTAWNCAFSPDGSRLGVARFRGVEIYELAQQPTIGHLVATVGEGLKTWSYAPSKNQLALAWIGKEEIALLDASTGERVSLIAGTSAGSIATLAFSPDEKSLWIGGSDGRVCRFDLDTMNETGAFQSEPGLVSMSVSPDGRVVSTAPELQFWDAETLTQISDVKQSESVHGTRHLIELRGHATAYVQLSIRLDVMCWGLDVLRLSDAPSLARGYPITCVAHSPEGSLIAVATNQPAIHLWDAATERNVQTLLGHPGEAERLAFSPDGRTLASSSEGDVRLWHVETGQQLVQLAKARGKSVLLAFSQDGRQLISVGPANRDGADGIVVWGAP